MNTAFYTLFLAALFWPLQGLSHGDEDHSQPPAQATITPQGPQRLGEGRVFVPKPLQFQWGVTTQRAVPAALPLSFTLNANLRPDPTTSGRLQAPVMGYLQPGPKGMPRLGETVKKGQVLVYLQPISSSLDVSNQAAQLVAIGAQQQQAQLQLNRLERLKASVSAATLDNARIEVARLNEQKTIIANSLQQPMALLAPVSGVISAAQPLRAGQMVDAKAELLDIIHPQHIGVEALAYQGEWSYGVEQAQLEVGQQVIPLDYLGHSGQLREQALPMWFRFTQANTGLAIGMVASVVVQTPQRIQGVAMPRSAVFTQADQTTAVWVLRQAETFELRTVKTQPLKGDTLAITHGLSEGERVVISGGSLLAQVR